MHFMFFLARRGLRTRASIISSSLPTVSQRVSYTKYILNIINILNIQTFLYLTKQELEFLFKRRFFIIWSICRKVIFLFLQKLLLYSCMLFFTCGSCQTEHLQRCEKWQTVHMWVSVCMCVREREKKERTNNKIM